MKQKLIMLLFLFAASTSLWAQRQVEKLGRGLIAYKTTSGMAVTWRVTAEEWDGVSYNLYRNGTKLNTEPITGATYYVDKSGAAGNVYTVSAIVDGVEQPACEGYTALANSYFDIPLDRPAGGATVSSSYTYSPNDCSVGDLDGDGEYEIIVKWDPSNSKDNAYSGHTGNVFIDAYTIAGKRLWRIDLGLNIRAGAHYTQFLVFDFDGDGKSELVCKTAPGTVDGTGKNVIMGTDNPSADYRNTSGYILSGPEYLTIFNGETGAEMNTVAYNPPRGTVSNWGDSYGNRVDRFLACVAYLDGKHPSIVMCRGYYARTTLAAWDWDGVSLKQRWYFDSSTSGNSAYAGQGNHNLSAVDVDFDGKDEIIYGACTIDHDGKGLYSTGLNHGDALHVSDFDPSRPGFEVFSPHEDKVNGISYRDAADGTILFQKKAASDIGRGMCGDFISGNNKAEFCGTSATGGTYDGSGTQISSSRLGVNSAIWWDGDDLREFLDGSDADVMTISKWGASTMLTTTGFISNNSTKSNSCLSADIFGDWREELIVRSSDNTKVRVYLTPYATSRRQYTLMHDSQYRLSVAWQNVAYNQPPHTGFFFGENMTTPPFPSYVGDRFVWNTGNKWDSSSANWTKNGSASSYSDGGEVLFDISGDYSSAIELSENVSPKYLLFNSPIDATIEGQGKITGEARLMKDCGGEFTLNNDNDYSGSTLIWKGTLTVNGTLENSQVTVLPNGAVGGTGIIKKGVVLENGSTLNMGPAAKAAGTLTVASLSTTGHTFFNFDIESSGYEAPKQNDSLIVLGDVTLSGTQVFNINFTGSSRSLGEHVLIAYDGKFTGNLATVTVVGLDENNPYELVNENNKIILKIEALREPSTVKWLGVVSNVWDSKKTKNWLCGNDTVTFVPGDTVVFGDDAVTYNVVMEGTLQPARVIAESTSDYTLSGSGSITGNCVFEKNDFGTFTVTVPNTFTGGTVVNDGRLDVTNTSYRALGSGSVVVNSGGTFGGTGIVTGPVTVEAGGIIAPGIETKSQGVLSVIGSVEMKKDAIMTVQSNTLFLYIDKLKASGKITVAGTLNVLKLKDKAYSGGSEYQILEGLAIEGTFSSIIPEYPIDFSAGGQKWDVSRLYTEGFLVVPFNVSASSTELGGVDIYPNPTSNIVNVDVTVDRKESITLLVTDIAGKKVIKQQFTSDSKIRFDMSTFASGVYFVSIESPSLKAVRKLVKR